MDDAYKAAEKRGYARGYSAGRAKKKELDARRRQKREQHALRDRVFLAMLPIVFGPGFNWGTKNSDGVFTPYVSVEERTSFAWKVARIGTNTEEY